MEDRKVAYTEQIKKYLEYCEFRKELDWNTLKEYRINLKQFFEYALEDILKKGEYLHKNPSGKMENSIY